MSESPDDVLEVGEFYQLVTAHLEGAFGRRRPRWVRGEIAKVYEKGHVYVDLVDAGSTSTDTKRPVLNAHCWATPWGPLKRRLADEGIALRAGQVVHLLGYVDVYAPQGKLGFSIVDVDVQGLVGEVARRRLELIARLREEGLLERNAARALLPVALRIGLIASPATEGYRDFTGQLLASRFSFDVVLVTTLVQGEGAPAQIVAALQRLDDAGCDLICIVRGGGSRGDLACFDDERVARAIASASTPVFTGIGHTGDESVADLVAHTRAITPTKLGEDLVARVRDWDDLHVRQPARRLIMHGDDLVDEASTYLGERRRTVVFAVRDRLRSESRHLRATRERLLLESKRVPEQAATHVAAVRQLLGAYDPRRRLAQGWSLVTNAAGELVRAASDVELGEDVRIVVASGALRATIKEREEVAT